MDPETTATADAQAADVGNTAGTPENGEQQKNGIQKRIDELTAKMYQKDADLQKSNETIAALTAQLSTVMEKALPKEQPQQADPWGEYSERVDPDFRRAMDSYFGRMQQQFDQRLNQMMGQVGGYQIQRVAQASGVTEPEVQRRAEELFSAWRSRGLQYTPEDALNFAVGEWYRTNRAKQGGQQQQQMSPGVTQGQLPPMPSPLPQQTRPLPPNFEDLSPDQQLQLLEARGVGKVPF